MTLTYNYVAVEAYLGRSPREAHHVRGSSCSSHVRGEARGVAVLGPFRGPEVGDLQTERTDRRDDEFSRKAFGLEKEIDDLRGKRGIKRNPSSIGPVRTRCQHAMYALTPSPGRCLVGTFER